MHVYAVSSAMAPLITAHAADAGLALHIFLSIMATSLKTIDARLIVLDIPKSSYPRPVVTQLALLTSLLLYHSQRKTINVVAHPISPFIFKTMSSKRGNELLAKCIPTQLI